MCIYIGGGPLTIFFRTPGGKIQNRTQFESKVQIQIKNRIHFPIQAATEHTLWGRIKAKRFSFARDWSPYNFTGVRTILRTSVQFYGRPYNFTDLRTILQSSHFHCYLQWFTRFSGKHGTPAGNSRNYKQKNKF